MGAPSTACMSAVQSRYSTGGSFGRSTRTPEASRRMRATVCPSGVATSNVSESSLCRQS
jgi:hypothetical protein